MLLLLLPLPAAATLREPSRFRGTQGTAVVGVFGMTCASTGASERTLKRVGTPYNKASARWRLHAAQASCVHAHTHGRGLQTLPARRLGTRCPPHSEFDAQIYVHPNNHAGYYPGAGQIDLKLLFAPDVRFGGRRRGRVLSQPRARLCAPVHLHHLADALPPPPGGWCDDAVQTGKILGCQATGLVAGVEKRVDVITMLACLC